MFNPQHFGLYFSVEHTRTARQQAKRAFIETAFDRLRTIEYEGARGVQWLGLRFRFDDDTHAGEQGAARLLGLMDGEINADVPYLDAVHETLILLQSVEMLRDHPALNPHVGRCLDALWNRIAQLDAHEIELTYVEGLWRGLLYLAGGIVLEREPIFAHGVEVYRAAVEQDIHPQGYIARAVEGGDGGSLHRQLLALSALVLMAEAASHAGVNLWTHELRGVSAMTAVMYPVYYFFRPDNWKWDTTADTALFRQYGGAFEIAHRHNPLPDLKLLLNELRPVCDPLAGGLPTLTHGAKRGWFPFG